MMGVNTDRLLNAIGWSMRQLQAPREQRLAAIRQYVGSHYSRGGADKRVPTNLMELAATIYIRSLAARAPRVMISTSEQSLKPFARDMELALNQIPDEINLGKTIRRTVLEAIFGLGVCKVGLCASDVCVLDHDVGEAFVDVVTIDDYFFDMAAKIRQAIQYEGNDYWLDIDDARDMYDGPSSYKVEPDDHTIGGEQGEPRAEGVGVEEGADLFTDKVWMRDVWLPRQNKLLTFGVKSRKVFREVSWDGPEGGPYHILSFSDVPGNLLPLPPAALWMDLHELANSVFRKLARQADAKKTVAAFQGGNDDSVNRLKDAADGDGINYNGPKPEMLTVGGIDAPSLAMFLQIRDLFSYFAGNLDSLGGLSPMTETVGQDKLLSEAANARMASMRAETIEFTKGIFKSLAWYEWTDPVRKRTIKKPIKGTDITLIKEWSAETRDGDFLDFNLDIDVYSMQDDTPTIRLQKLGQIMQLYVLPMIPLLQQQGAQIDVRKLIETVGRLGNLPELADLIVFAEPMQVPPTQGGAEQGGYKPANTTRTYERVNRPGATRQGKDDVMSRILMGAGVQGSEAAALRRPST